MHSLSSIQLISYADINSTDELTIKGDGSIWTKGTERGLEFTANGSYSKFAGIEVDGETVNEENYTAISGSTVST